MITLESLRSYSYSRPGIGIEKLHLESIFDIFSKIHDDLQVKGQGIGLAYSRRIVRNYRGTITAYDFF